MSTRTHPRPGARWERIALIASLALNLSIIGVVAGFALRGPAPDSDRVFLPIEGMRQIHRALPAEDRAALRHQMRSDLTALSDHHARLRDLRAAMLDALGAEPFDPQRLEAAMAQQGAYWQTASRQARKVFVTHVASMTPQARAAFAQALTESMQRPRQARRPPEAHTPATR